MNVKWSRNGKELSRDNQTDFDKTAVENLIKYTLTIKNVEEENSGDYSCFYENLMISCRVIVKVGILLDLRHNFLEICI